MGTPLRRRCPNNHCKRNVVVGERFCRKHLAEAREAQARKYAERKFIDEYRRINGSKGDVARHGYTPSTVVLDKSRLALAKS